MVKCSPRSSNGMCVYVYVCPTPEMPCKSAPSIRLTSKICWRNKSICETRESAWRGPPKRDEQHFPLFPSCAGVKISFPSNSTALRKVTEWVQKNQRAEDGGLDPSWLNFAFLERPRFSVQRSQDTNFKGFGGLWTKDRGAPNTRKSTTTDPIPHSRPSEKSQMSMIFPPAILDQVESVDRCAMSACPPICER